MNTVFNYDDALMMRSIHGLCMIYAALMMDYACRIELILMMILAFWMADFDDDGGILGAAPHLKG